MTYPTRDGFTLALVEEFDAPLDLDKDPIWTWSDGGLSEGAVRFVKDAISFDGGMMKLTVSKSSVAGSDSYAEPVANAPKGFVPLKPLRSGEVRTRFNNFRYGRYEVLPTTFRRVRLKAAVEPSGTTVNFVVGAIADPLLPNRDRVSATTSVKLTRDWRFGLNELSKGALTTFSG